MADSQQKDPRLAEWEPADLKAAMDRGEVVVIDVREPYEFGFERIQGAMTLPLASFEPKMLPVGGDRTVVYHCGTGKRSGFAADKCFAAGMEGAIHLKGGINAWKEAKMPTVAIDPTTGIVIREMKPASPDQVEAILAAAADGAGLLRAGRSRGSPAAGPALRSRPAPPG